MNNFIRNNSSTILTIIGSIGVGITAVMSARDTIKAMKRIEEEKALTKKKKFKLAASCYIPTLISGVSTILCICGANKINKDVQKSLTGAYVLLDRSYKEYRNAVKELHGKDGDLEVIKNIADNRTEELLIKPTDGIMCFDFLNLQFFKSSLATIKEAEGIANEMLKSQGYVSLATMRRLLGEPDIKDDYALGWSMGAGQLYGYDNIEISAEEARAKDGSTYYVLDFENGPTDDYMYYL